MVAGVCDSIAQVGGWGFGRMRGLVGVDGSIGGTRVWRWGWAVASHGQVPGPPFRAGGDDRATSTCGVGWNFDSVFVWDGGRTSPPWQGAFGAGGRFLYSRRSQTLALAVAGWAAPPLTRPVWPWMDFLEV